MAMRGKDIVATLLTALVVLTFAATHEGWNVWLVGDSRRWATGAILLLGMATCALGSRGRDKMTVFLATLGVLALVLGVVSLVTASLTALSILVADIVLLWALSTARHALHEPGKPLPA
jgi:hypothetical protein